MKVVFMTGIWPPDVGGPATHGPDFASFLRDRGHSVQVVTMADGAVTVRPVPVTCISRTKPFVIRYPAVALAGARLARRADVLYATATYAAAAAAATAARTPLVVKLVSDPAYERARRYGVFRGSLEAFQRAGGARTDGLKRLRTTALRKARRIVVPSAYLADIARGWGVDESRLEVLVNPAPPPQDVVPAALAPGTFVFAGRLTEQKALPLLLEALGKVPEARVVLVGDGPERAMLDERTQSLGLSDRVTFAGALDRASVLSYLAGARAAVLPSAWENLPHAAVESLAVGTPVIATAVGGVPEVVEDGVNGRLVASGDVAALASAMHSVMSDDALRDRLAAGALRSVERMQRDAVYGRLESILREAA